MIAYGYMRLDSRDELALDSLPEQIEKWCQAEGYELEEIFVDHAPGVDLVRAGFEALVAALLENEGARVVVVDLDHLSPLPTTRMALMAKIRSLGGSVASTANDLVQCEG